MRPTLRIILFLAGLGIGRTVLAQRDSTAIAATLAGRRALAWVQAVNSGSDAVVQPFLKANLSPGELADGPPIAQRLARYRGIHDSASPLVVERLVSNSEREVTLLVTGKGGKRLHLRMRLEPEAPYGIGQVGLEDAPPPAD